MQPVRGTYESNDEHGSFSFRGSFKAFGPCKTTRCRRSGSRSINLISLSPREVPVQNSEPIDSSVRPIPLSILLMIAAAVHMPLLLMGFPLRSYDTNFHIFFASHYVHHWFDPWNAKWYAGFSQTTYPPLPQQLIALLSHLDGIWTWPIWPFSSSLYCFSWSAYIASLCSG